VADAQQLQVHELYTLDRESMDEIGPVHGLIFLFRYRGEKDERATVDPGADDVFFASQMIPNACATQARATPRGPHGCARTGLTRPPPRAARRSCPF